MVPSNLAARAGIAYYLTPRERVGMGNFWFFPKPDRTGLTKPTGLVNLGVGVGALFFKFGWVVFLSVI